MTAPLIIGLAATRPGSGKTTVAQSLVSKAGFIRLPMAEPLKQIGMAILGVAGIPAAAARRYLYEDRDSRIPIVGVNGRRLLQTLGTEWGRRCISEDIWTTLWVRKLDELDRIGRRQGVPLRVVVDDVRFPNEADLIRSLGGHMWLIDRPRTRLEARQEFRQRFSPAQLLRHPGRLLPWNWLSSGHASEGGLNRYPHYRARIRNDATIHDLLIRAWREAAELGAYPTPAATGTVLSWSRSSGSSGKVVPITFNGHNEPA